jgi:hypothetical protein
MKVQLVKVSNAIDARIARAFWTISLIVMTKGLLGGLPLFAPSDTESFLFSVSSSMSLDTVVYGILLDVLSGLPKKVFVSRLQKC